MQNAVQRDCAGDRKPVALIVTANSWKNRTFIEQSVIGILHA